MTFGFWVGAKSCLLKKKDQALLERLVIFLVDRRCPLVSGFGERSFGLIHFFGGMILLKLADNCKNLSEKKNYER